MASLATELKSLNQNAASVSLDTRSGRRQFVANTVADLAGIIAQWNVVANPIFSTLTDDVIDTGLEGRTIISDGGATAYSGDILWNSSSVRQNRVDESFKAVASEVSRLENLISLTTAAPAYNDTAIWAAVNANTANVDQVTQDTFGGDTTSPTYTLDDDGAPDLRGVAGLWSMAYHIEQIGTQLITGWPGTGINFGGLETAGYPTLSFTVNASGINWDVQVAQTNVASSDGTAASAAVQLANIMTYTGMTNSGDSAPTYSSTTVITNGDSLETAIGKLDAATASGSLWSVASNVVYNSGGTPGTDDFVFGSNVIGSLGLRTTYLAFDQSASAIRAGRATGTEWDTRGNYSACFGDNNEALGSASGCFVGDGGYVGATSTGAWIGGGLNCSIGATAAAAQAVIAGGNGNTIGGALASTVSYIGGGSNNDLDGTFNVIGGGEGNEIKDTSATTAPSWASILGGKLNIIDSTQTTGSTVVGANGCHILGGESNRIEGATYSHIFGGLGNQVGDQAKTPVLGNTSIAYGTILGGEYNRTQFQGSYATAMGRYALASTYGMVAQSASNFSGGTGSNAGESQTGKVTFTGQAGAAVNTNYYVYINNAGVSTVTNSASHFGADVPDDASFILTWEAVGRNAAGETWALVGDASGRRVSGGSIVWTHRTTTGLSPKATGWLGGAGSPSPNLQPVNATHNASNYDFIFEIATGNSGDSPTDTRWTIKCDLTWVVF